MIKNLLTRIAQAVLPTVEAHCDTADGPAVTDGRRALESGDLNLALKWIPASGEDELREVFAKAMAVRSLNADAAYVADRLFLETLIRLHRLTEGVGFTGIQGSGAFVEPVVLEADRALETGDLAPVLALVPEGRRDELTRRFEIARGKQGYAPDDVPAGRDFIASYVSFFKYAEVEEHEHGGHGEHGHHGEHAERPVDAHHGHAA